MKKPLLLFLSFFLFHALLISQEQKDRDYSHIKFDSKKINLSKKKVSGISSKSETTDISNQNISEFRNISSTSEVGETFGEFSVSQTGAATYSIPISVPPGIKDAVPNVSLSFNSQASNSLAGYGWSISGISTITRISSTKFHDNDIDGIDFDLKDRFALDGQRLILKSGTYGAAGSVYETENYSNLKIRAVGTSPYGANYGPSYFVVNYPDGSIGYYGNYGGSRSRLEWSIGRWENPQGLRLNYTYSTTGNLLSIANIKYGSRNSTSGINEIRFIYKNRNRPERLYAGEFLFERNQILDDIQVYANSSLQRKYDLTHSVSTLGYERLENVQEFNGTNEALNPIIFTYNNSSNLITSYTNIDDEGQAFDPGFTYQDYGMVGGDFNGDGRSDFITYKKSNKNEVYVFTGLLDSNYDYGHKVNTGAFDDVVSTNALWENNKLFQDQSFTTINQTQISTSSSTTKVTFKNFATTIFGTGFDYEKVWNAPAAYAQNVCGEANYQQIPRRYISGDFNGDGLTDLLAINKPYTTSTCYIEAGCDGHDPWLITNSENTEKINTDSSSVETQSMPPPPIDPCCQCNYTNNNGGQVTFINLDRFKTTNFTNNAGTINDAIATKDQLFAADVNGDGKADLIHFREDQIKVYNFSSATNQLELMLDTGIDNYISPNNQLLTGDFNGDGKLDFAQPAGNNSDKWKFFLTKGNSFHSYIKDLNIIYKEPFVYQSTFGDRYVESHYIAQDFNSDGKTDILAHHVDSSTGTLGQTIETFNLYENRQSFSDPTPFFTLSKTEDFWTDSKKFGSPIPMQLNSNTYNPVYAYVSLNTIYGYEFTKSHVKDMTLSRVSNSNGVDLDIEYANLVPENYSTPAYTNDLSEFYPYANVNVLPGLHYVTSITETAKGQSRYQDFQYMGAVSHAGGLGFLGFKGYAQSNWHDNTNRLFTTTIFSPQLRGAPTKQHTSSYPNFNFNGTGSYVNKTTNTYSTETTSSKVFKNKLTESVSFDNLTQVQTTTQYTYNTYLSPTRVKTIFPGGYNQIDYSYNNNVTATNNTYHVGRPATKKETRNLGSETISKEEQYTYSNNLVKIIKLKGNNTAFITKTMTHDVFGNILTLVTSASGETNRNESYTYDASGRYILTFNGIEGFTTTFEYFTNTGLLKKESDHLGNSTQYTYDSWNRPATETNYLNKATTYTYERIANNQYTILKTVPGGASQKTTYDDLNRVIVESVDAGMGTYWINKKYEYDVLGRTKRTSEPYFSNQSPTQWNETQYDQYGRITQQSLFNGEIITSSYNQLTVTVDDGTKTVMTTTDATGNVVSMTDPGGTVSYTYFSDGNMKSANYGGHTVTITQDGWGRKTQLNDPAAGIYTYSYDIWGNPLTETTPEGTTTYDYDQYGRIIEKEVIGNNTDETVTYTYKTNGLLGTMQGQSVGSGSVSSLITYAHDTHGRITTSTEVTNSQEFTSTYTYDGFGRISTEYLKGKSLGIDHGFTTKNIYLANGTLSEIRNNGNNALLWKLNNVNARLQTTSYQNGNGKTTSTTYNQYGFPTQIQHGNLFTLGYNFDEERGNLNSRSNSLFTESESFTYDSQDRLTTITNSLGSKTKTYDTRGRITNDPAIGDFEFQNTYKIASVDLNASGLAYYQNHSLQEIEYNAYKKPIKIHEQGKGRVDFSYTAFGSRYIAYYGGTEVDKTNRTFRKTYSSNGAIEVTHNQDTNKKKKITFIGGDAYSAPLMHVQTTSGSTYASGFYYLHRDYQGSIIGISNQAGNLVEKRHFGAWGEVMHYDASVGNTNANTIENDGFALLDRGYTGHEHFFQVGLIHMNGRMYDAKLGRFLSPDNFIQDPYNSQSYNRFGYAYNNPLKYSDPSGEWFWGFFIPAAIGATVNTIVNGVGNLVNGQSFFYGAGKAALSGAVGGAAAYGVGELAGVLNLSLSPGMTALVQTAAHGFVGGAVSVMQGGDFGSGFAGGFNSSIASAAILGSIANTSIHQTLKVSLTIIGGGVIGGYSAYEAGGSFWQGFGYGVLAAGLNHALHELELAFTKVQNGMVGIYGAGGDLSTENLTLKKFIEKWDGKIFRPNQHRNIMNHLEKAAKLGYDIDIYGYSRGGRRAVLIANALGKKGIRVDRLITFDPHRGLGRSLTLKYSNVIYVENHYQHNPVTSGPLPFGNNPYIGGKIIYNFGIVNQFNYTGQPVNHNNIIRHAGY